MNLSTAGRWCVMTRRCITVLLVVLQGAVSAPSARAQSSTPAVTVTPNVNVLRNVSDPLLGDALLQRQNEAVVAVSTRNPDHIMIAANDYRTVDISSDQGIGDVFSRLIRTMSRTAERLIASVSGRDNGFTEAEEEERERAEAGTEAWVGVYVTNDRGRNWANAWMPGYPQDTTVAGKNSPAYGKQAASDPVLVSAPAGRFYLGAMAFDRGGASTIVVSRFTDRNNSEKGNNFHFDLMRQVDSGPSGKSFLDKPAIAVDVARNSSDPASCGPVYIGYTVFDTNISDPNDRSRILVTTSLDCGNTWLAPRKVNLASKLVQGVALAIRPSDGRLYAAYRDFAANSIYVTWADDRGYTFAPPVKVSGTMMPFDQPTLGAPDYAFRTNAFPTLTVDGDGVIYVGWQERLAANGNPRIVVTTSADGKAWTAKTAVESTRCVVDANGTQTCGVAAGPQVMPSLASSRGRVMMLFYEARPGIDDVKWVASQNASYITGLDVQLYLRVAQLDATGKGISAIATQYQTDKDGKPLPIVANDGTTEYRAANRPNLPMYQGGKSAFIGDYISIAPTMPFVPTSLTPASQTASNGLGFLKSNPKSSAGQKSATPFWRWATEPTDGPTAAFQAVWTDNRDVIFPRDANGVPRIDGDWSKYAPPGSGPCINPGSRNANVYTAEIAPRLVAGSPTTFKQLGIQRAFVVYLQNRTADRRFYRMTIVDSPPQVDGSFLQRGQDLNIRDYEVFPLSTVSDSVFVTGTASAQQPVRVDIVEIDKQDGVPIAGGDTATVVFNADSSNPALDVADPSSETHTPKLFTPGNTGSSLPKITNPQLANPQLANPQLANPQLANPQLANPQLANLQLTNSPYADPTGDVVQNVTNYTWQVSNVGTTASAFTPVFNIANQQALQGKKVRLYIYNTYKTPIFVQTTNGCQAVEQPRDVIISVIENPQLANPQLANPQLANPQLANPQLANPQLANSTFYAAPADSATANGTAAALQRNVIRNVALQSGTGDTDLAINIPPPDTFITLQIQDGDTFQVGPPPPPPAPGEPPPPFDPPLPLEDFQSSESALGVISDAAPVINGVVQPIVESVSTSADLVFSSTPTVTPLSLQAGGLVTVSSFDVTVIGNTSTAGSGFRYGFYLSPTVEINPSTAVFLGNLTHDGSIAPGEIVTLPGGTFAIPPTTTPGQYYVGVFLNDGQMYTPALNPYLFESFSNDTVALALTIAAPVGTAPTATADTASTNEDTALNVAAPGVLGNDGNAGPVTAVLSLGASHGTVTLNADGSYVYAPAPNYYGPDSFTYYASNGTLASPLTTVSINVGPVNDAPSFTIGADQTTQAYTPVSIPNWATNISAGPANESTQTVNFIVTPTNPGLFIAQPAVSPTGTLTYSTAGIPGSTTVSVSLHDDGGTASGGVDTSAAQLFTITVQAPVATSDVQVSQLHSPETPAVGSNVTYTVTVTNNGPDTATGVTVSDTYPAGLSWVSSTSSFGACGTGDFGVVCNLGNLESGVTATITMTYSVVSAQPITHTVTASSTSTDLVSANDTATDLSMAVYPPCSTAEFSGPFFTDLGTFSAGIIAVADFDQDGVQDVAVTSGQSANTIEVVFGGTTTPVSFAVGTNPASVSTGDFNHDGNPDLVVANGGSSNVSVLLGDGAGGFAPAVNYAVPPTPFSTEIGDLNNDGNLDLVIGYGSTGASKIAVSLGNGTGGFGAATQWDAGQQPTNVIVADFDSDGNLDVAVPNTGTNTISFLKGDGAGGFSAPTAITVAAAGTAVQRLRNLGDINNDGRPDLGVTIGSPSSLALLLNAGGGSFAPPVEIIPPSNVGFALAGDFNGDGKTDIAAINPGSNRILVLIGDGTGSFTTTAYATNASLNHLAIADLNNDGRVDIVGTARGSFYTLLNTCGTPEQSDLTVTSSAPPNSPNTTTYSVQTTVTNNGPGVASQVHITHALGNGLTYVGVSGAVCGELNGSVSCDIGSLNAGASVSIAVDVQPHAEGQRVVSVSATSQTTELAPADNYAQATTTVAAGPATFTVTTTADAGPGSLRDAITASNLNTGGGNTIRFDIPGSGAHSIPVLSQLPGITASVLIDGNSQPGYAGTPLVTIDGQNAIANGVILNGPGTIVRGLEITRFTTGVRLNSGNGIIKGNTVTANGTAIISFSSDNQIGGLFAGDGNIIANNTGTGIGVQTGVRNAIRGNSIFGNGLLGIDNGTFLGLTPNDAGDTDTGPNNLQNFPVVASAVALSGVTTIAGTLNSSANSTFAIDLFANSACDASGNGEGERFLGSLSATTDGSGNASFSTTFSGVAVGEYITTTATDAAGNTSEFSACRPVTPGIVTTDFSSPIPSGELGSGFISLDAHHDATAFPQVVNTLSLAPSGKPDLAFPSVMAVLPAAGSEPAIGLFGANGRIGVLDLATGTVTGAITVADDVAPSIARANTTTRIAYFVSGNRLIAIDGRSAEATYKTPILTTTIGTAIRGLAINESTGRVFVVSTTNVTNTNFTTAQISVIDGTPGSGTFHQLLNSVNLGSFGVNDVAINPVSNKVYVADTAGLHVFNATSLAVSQVGSVPAAASVAVNPTKNVVYTSNGFNGISSVDGSTDTRFTTFALTTSGGPSATGEGRLVIHNASGRVFYHYGDGPQSSKLVVIDGDPTHTTTGNNTFNTVLTSTPAGWETSLSPIAIDQGADRVVLHNYYTRTTTVLDALTNATIATVTAPQGSSRPIVINPSTHTAYVALSVGAIQTVDLATGAAQVVHTGTEVRTPVVDTTAHLAYVPRTGSSTGLAVFNQAGLQTTVTTASGAGQFRFAERNATTDRIYAVNFAANAAGDHDGAPGSVSVIDGATKTVVANVAVGNRPATIAVDSVLNRVYIGNTSVLNDVSANYHSWAGITVIDGATNTATAANLDPIVASAISVNSMAVNTSTGRLYFRAQNGSNVGLAWLDPATNNAATISTTLGPIAQIKVNPVLNRVYVGTSDGRFHIIDGSSNTLITTLNIGNAPGSAVGTLQNWIAVNKTTGRVYVTDNNNDTVTVVDGNSNTVVATISRLENPFAVAVNETTNRVYVLDGGDDSVVVIDGATNTVLHALNLPMNVVAMSVDDQLSPAQIYVIGECANGVGCVESDTGVMLVSDPIDPYGAITLTSVGPAAHGTASVNADGSVSYQSNAGYVGTDSFTYTVTDANGASATGTVTLNVVAVPVITTTTLPPTTVGASYNQTLAVTGATAPYRWTITSGQFPAGLALDEATGKISGVASQSGTYFFNVAVQDVFGDDASAALSIVVGPLAIITALPNPTYNVAYSQQLFVGGNSNPVTWSINKQNSPLLSWLSLSASGQLTGTPTAYGTLPPFIVTATDSVTFQTATRTYTLTVGGPLDIVQTTLREGVVMETGEPAIPIVGGTGAKSVTLLSGDASLPPGITLNINGSFTGSPKRHGTYTIIVQVTDASSPPQTIIRTLTWRVSAREQQGSTQTQSNISFGGAGGRKIAQTFTAAAAGKLTGVGSFSLSCSLQGPVTVDIQRLTLAGVPDGNTLATGTAINNFSAISVNPPVDVAIDERLAFVWSSPTSCDISNAPANDTGYQSGDALVDAGSGWVTLASTDGRYDVPFRTLIQPAADVVYFNAGRFDGANASPLAGGTKVLITGTDNTGDVYNEATNTATQTPALNTPVPSGFNTQRYSHTSTLLNDGTVLIAGGRNSTGTSTRLTSAETYNPTSNTYTLTTGTMLQGRESAGAVRLQNGKVLIVGGSDGSQNLASAELYDPATRTFSSAGTMTTGRNWPLVVLLNNGKVLIAGGYVSSVNGAPTRSAELYDPAAGTFTATTGGMVLSGRGRATATLLADGRVLIAGGQVVDIRDEAEVYDPATDSFSATATPMTTKRFTHTGTLLPDGSVLIAGGYDSQNVNGYILPLATLERYVPGTNSFVPAGSMEVRRASHVAVALGDGKVLLAGGTSANGWFIGDTGELYDLAGVPSLTTTSLPDGQVGVAYPSTSLAAGGGAGGPYTIALAYGVLPAGMNYDQPTATLSGTPSSSGTFRLGFRVTDGSGNANVQTLTIRVGAVPVITTPYRLVDGAVGRAYSVPLAAANATAPLTWSSPPGSASMPAGVSINTSGVIAGTPQATGFFNFVVRLVDGTGQSVYKTFAINVTNPLVITTASLPELAVLENTSGCFSILNGFGTKTWSLTATPSTGVGILQNGCLAPTALGTYQISAQVTDQSSPPQVATANFNVRVSAREQQAFTSGGSTTAFGGSGGRIIAQTMTVGANGTLTAVGFNSATTCSGAGMTVNVQGVTLDGRPDGNSLASGFTTGSLAGISLGAGVPVTVGQRLALVINASGSCTTQNNDPNDYYQAGDAFVSTGSGWVPLLSTDNRYDFPLRLLIQPSAPLTYLTANRNGSAVAPLNNGKVLIAGPSSAEIYDPATATTTATGNPVFSFFLSASAVLDDGTVLFAGGNVNGVRFATAQTYDPSTGTFTGTANNLSVARDGATAVKLPNGKVLVVGGYDGLTNPTAADLYDPATRTFTQIGNMISGRNSPIAILLDNGKVLIAGGYISGPKSAELYDPLAGPNGTFTATTGDMISFGRGRAAAAKLADGRVLITGGQWGDVLNSAEVYDPVTDTFTAAGNMSSARYLHTATTLADGSVLIAGGDDAQSWGEYTLPLATLERYIPDTNSFVPAGSMVVRRQSHGAVRLVSGKVLLAGGDSQSWLTNNSAELYDLGSTPVLSPTTLPDGQVNVAYPTTTLSGSGGDGGPYTITQVAGGLPPNMTFNSATRQISGTPTLAGVYTAGFNVATGSGSNVQSLTIRVGNLLTITSPYRLVDGAFGQPYSVQLQTANATGSVAWALTTNSALPANLTLSPTGLVSGTLNTFGYYNFAVKATDASGQSATKVLSISINNPLTITTTSLSEAVVWENYGYCINANNGVGNRTYTITGPNQPPPGVTLQPNGCFANAPTALGTFPFTVQVTDSASPPEVVTQNLTMRVSAEDQSAWADSSNNPQTFGSNSQRSVARVFTAGVAGLLNGVQILGGLTCPATNPSALVSAEVRYLNVDSTPSDTVIASGTANWWEPIVLSTPLSVGQGERYAIVFSTTSTCTLALPDENMWVPGDAFERFGSGAWSRLVGKDVPFRTLMSPTLTIVPLSYWRGAGLVVKLANGKVLIAGGENNSADVFDPATNVATPTGSMLVQRRIATATLLNNGKVLITGGYDGSWTPLSSGEVYDPATGTFNAVSNAMTMARAEHTATLLNNGQVMIAGGWNGSVSAASVEFYDSGSNQFIAGGNMTGSRSAHTATKLNDGRVLFVGGNSNGPFPVANAEVYDPGTATFTPSAEAIQPLRAHHTATLLSDGRVLIAGGTRNYPNVEPIIEFYNPSTNTLTTGPAMGVPRMDAAAVRDGNDVLVMGGTAIPGYGQDAQSEVERFVFFGGDFEPAGNLAVQRNHLGVVDLGGGRFFAAAGWGSSSLAAKSGEIYWSNPATITPPVAPDGQIGVTYDSTFSINGAQQASLTSGQLPSGVDFSFVTSGADTVGMALSGTPDAAGTYTFNVELLNTSAHLAVQPFTVRIDPLTVTTKVMPDAHAGVLYGQSLSATTSHAPLTWTLVTSTGAEVTSGAGLPSGLTLSSNGQITGTPLAAGWTTFTVRVRDALGQTRLALIGLNVLP